VSDVQQQPGARLIWTRPDGAEAIFPIGSGGATVGRDEMAEVFLDEVLVSRGHARIEMSGADWVVKDLGSTNGTRVNGKLVKEKQLHDGDELRFARARCVFRS
jgi:adenylate cyclase